MQLNHVALTVADREHSARFYEQHFGLRERIHADDHLLILGSGSGAVLALSEGVVPDLPRTNHFGFQLPARDDVRAARERFRHADVAEAEWQDAHGMVRVQICDPDGYRVDVYAF